MWKQKGFDYAAGIVIKDLDDDEINSKTFRTAIGNVIIYWFFGN